jgi:hypothetical protein
MFVPIEERQRLANFCMQRITTTPEIQIAMLELLFQERNENEKLDTTNALALCCANRNGIASWFGCQLR